MRKRTTHISRVRSLLDNPTRTLSRPGSTSALERAYAMAVNARDHARDRFEAMDFAHRAKS